MLKAVLILVVFLAGCSVNAPTQSIVYEEQQTLIAETKVIGKQTLVRDQPLTKYQIEGELYYCSELVSLDLELYRCFTYDGVSLTHGLHPLNYELVKLPEPVAIYRVDKGRKP